MMTHARVDPSLNDWSAQRVVIVGGTAGIGLATARRVAALGAQAVILCGRSTQRGEAAAGTLAAEFPDTRVRFFQADAASPHESDALVQVAASEIGGIDALVSCAGGDVMPRLLADIPTDEVMSVLQGVAACVMVPARSAYEFMRQQGHGCVVCVASDAGKVATPGESVIGAAMAAIAMFCRGMAIEAKRDGIRVNCVTPSIVKGTPLYDRLQADPFASKLFSKAEKLAQLGIVTANDVADLITFLIGPHASKITGQTVSVTGGISAV